MFQDNTFQHGMSLVKPKPFEVFFMEAHWRQQKKKIDVSHDLKNAQGKSRF